MNKQDILAMSADEYMSEVQLQFFRDLINEKIAELRGRISECRTVLELLEVVPDPGDAATIEEERQKVTTSIRRDSMALDELVEAVNRINDESYGYCETGFPIGLPRLMVHPAARLCIEAQERRELLERHHSRLIA